MAGPEPVQVIRKATSLLERLAEEDELTAAQLAELEGEPKSTVHRLLASLESLGYVERGSTRGTYRVGLKVLQLGSSVLGRFDERKAAYPALRRLHDETEQSVYLCVRRGLQAICIERIDGRWVRSMVLQVGGSLPLHIGAAPRVLLAFAGRPVWDEYFTETTDLHTLVGGDPYTHEKLLDRLQQICDRGYEVSDGETAIGMAGVGAPVFDFTGRVRASISISGPTEALLGARQEATAAAVTATATDISEALGFRADPTNGHLAWSRTGGA
jgi:DNA-binding IclR family transcriptional regulator